MTRKARFRPVEVVPLRRSAQLVILGLVSACVVMGVLLLMDITIFVGFPLAALAALAIGVFGRPGAVHIGHDGLLLKRPTGTQFIPIAELREVETWIELGKGRQVGLKIDGLVVSRWTGRAIYLPMDADVDEIARVKQVLSGVIARATGRETEKVAVLARGGRTVEAWRKELRSLLVRGATFRTPAFSRDDARKVLRDPSASIEQRLGAAMALQGLDDVDVSRRIRRIGAASVRPPLRIALERIADDDDAAAEIEAALAAAEPRKRARSRRN